MASLTAQLVNRRPLSFEEWAGRVRSGFDSGDAVETLDLIISQAVLHQVSDIHFRCEDSSVKVLVRQNGLLRDLSAIPYAFSESLFTRLKVLGRLVTYQKRLPQDGHIDPKPYTDDPHVDIRVAVAPIVAGEQAVVRILYGSGGLLPLESLGWEGETLERYREVIFRRRGVVLLTGPCGSGKTTTIAASLRTLRDSAVVNICTVEDPVEYRLPGISQMAVDETAGVGFAEGIRAWLRHDPDILAVGEIRDSETARVVTEAGLLGHLVFSTLHGGSVAAVILRLLDMGVVPSTLVASLKMIISQRLVRDICPRCRAETDQWPLGFQQDERPAELKTFWVGRGCAECDFTGYQGRQGIFELVTLKDDLREAILARPAVGELKKIIRGCATSTLWGDGWRLVASGKTTPQELLRVIGE